VAACHAVGQDVAAYPRARDFLVQLGVQLVQLGRVLPGRRLVPVVLGLGAALESVVERTAAREDRRVDLSVELSWEPGAGAARLASDVEETIYRLVQEALHNAVRHAEALTVEVRVAEDADVVRMTVGDDGRGFDADAPPGGFGLLGMRERVDLVEGELEVTSAPGRGTVVAATVPLRRARAPALRPATADRA